MSTIGPDSHLSLASGLHRIDGPLDDLRRQQGGDAHEVQGTTPTAEAEAAPRALADAGERVLAAPAWDTAGARMLAGDLGLEGRLGALPLAQAAEGAVDAVLDAFA
ncbi:MULTISPECIES: hypothetical protein [unclassified Luteimonas]|uniref:hypothetical protein n=1 Tax=unclassified Luteimonas TaxID=2629088 RepID=UPI0018F0D039|nr:MULTISPECIES: hypothetical protein [unclassified Luteimonas]MBJ6979148.1 hypothetical protein [Luteimonas sp. MC1895]MBJ6985164.1 hypothetical protein [Luteimonas sp. MC1750]QQO05819.1 hypothetical protein JGR68_13595 [Luteimonas sp. MC1750]